MLSGIKLIDVPRTEADGQVYMQSFCEAWKRMKGDFVRREGGAASRFCREAGKLLVLAHLWPRRRETCYMVCARGAHLLKACMPYRGNFVPLLWDCWPDTWPQLERDLRLLDVRLCFVTSGYVAERLQRIFPDRHFVHVPEGVDVADYRPGGPLVGRPGDVYELGRKKPGYHDALVRDGFSQRHVWAYNKDGAGRAGWVYPTFREFSEGLGQWKITVSFPRSDTDALAGGVETLTIRYWEAMLSKCLIVGHCPAELEKIVGYNPVIEADEKSPAGQLDSLLAHIGDFQSLVDRNYRAALKFAPWERRVEQVAACWERWGAEISGIAR